jgi:hypothetical protein
VELWGIFAGCAREEGDARAVRVGMVQGGELGEE